MSEYSRKDARTRVAQALHDWHGMSIAGAASAAIEAVDVLERTGYLSFAPEDDS